MKKFLFPVIFLTFFILPVTGGEAKKNFLILGFSSPVMDEIEERFMREEVLRALAAKGGSIVPVMKTEELIRSRQNFSPLSVSDAEMEKLARAADARLVVTGTVDCVGCRKMKKPAIDFRFLYRCRVKVLLAEKRKTVTFTLKRRGDTDRYRFIRAFSREIAAILTEKNF